MGNLTVVSQINWPLIPGNLSVVSILLSNVKSHRYFNPFLALYCRRSIHRFSFLSQMENQTVVLTIFYLRLQAMYPLFQFFSQMGNRIVVLTIFWLLLVGNLYVVSILLPNGKSNRCLNNFFAFDCRQSICCFNSFVKQKISPLFQRFFGFAL